MTIINGLCSEIGGDAWFPEQGESHRDAKRICAMCDQRLDCLAGALERNEQFGIWGGMSERERRNLRKQRKDAAA